MNVGIIASNLIKIHPDVTRGTESFLYNLLDVLHRYKQNKIHPTLFSSGDSLVPVDVRSLQNLSSLEDKDIGLKKQKIFELALISKAFSLQKEFDLYHVNIGSGEVILPFAQFVNKPIVITLHSPLTEKWQEKIFSIYNSLSNVHYISISDHQRLAIPNLPYIQTIYHGINTELFSYCENSNESLLWLGRAIPQKGMEIALEVISKTQKKSQICAIPREDYIDWFHKIITLFPNAHIHTEELSRKELIKKYQESKAFLFPIEWEEPFGLVLIESMATGTPVIAFARGSVPEIVEDGKTGYIINPSDDDIRGEWTIKKTGVEGFCEAVETLYSLSHEEYLNMRKACRKHVEQHFTLERMVNEYEEVYKKILES